MPRQRGRPRELIMPERIPATPEQIARACMKGPPKKEWDYLKPGSAAIRRPGSASSAPPDPGNGASS